MSTATPESIRVGAMCAAARDRRTVRYTSRGRTGTATLVYFPGNDRAPHPLRGGRGSSSKAKVRTAFGRFLSVDPDSVELIEDVQ